MTAASVSARLGATTSDCRNALTCAKQTQPDRPGRNVRAWRIELHGANWSNGGNWSRCFIVTTATDRSRASGIATRNSSAASHNPVLDLLLSHCHQSGCPCSSKGGDPEAVVFLLVTLFSGMSSMYTGVSRGSVLPRPPRLGDSAERAAVLGRIERRNYCCLGGEDLRGRPLTCFGFPLSAGPDF